MFNKTKIEAIKKELGITNDELAILELKAREATATSTPLSKADEKKLRTLRVKEDEANANEALDKFEALGGQPQTPAEGSETVESAMEKRLPKLKVDGDFRLKEGYVNTAFNDKDSIGVLDENNPNNTTFTNFKYSELDDDTCLFLYKKGLLPPILEYVGEALESNKNPFL